MLVTCHSPEFLSIQANPAVQFLSHCTVHAPCWPHAVLSRLAEGTSRHFAAQPFTGKGGAAIKLPPILMYDSVQDFRDAMHSK